MFKTWNNIGFLEVVHGTFCVQISQHTLVKKQRFETPQFPSAPVNNSPDSSINLPAGTALRIDSEN